MARGFALAQGLAAGIKFFPQGMGVCQECRCRQAPHLFTLNCKSAAMPIGHNVAQQALELGTGFPARNGNCPGCPKHRGQRRLESSPFRQPEIALNGRVVEQITDAAPVLHCEFGISGAIEHLQFQQVALRHDPVEVATLRGTHLLATGFRPVIDVLLRRHEQGDARGVIVGFDHGDNLATFYRVPCRRQQHVNAALFKLLQAVGA